jgi:hypothetical protein
VVADTSKPAPLAMVMFGELAIEPEPLNARIPPEIVVLPV